MQEVLSACPAGWFSAFKSPLDMGDENWPWSWRTGNVQCGPMSHFFREFGLMTESRCGSDPMKPLTTIVHKAACRLMVVPYAPTMIKYSNRIMYHYIGSKSTRIVFKSILMNGVPMIWTQSSIYGMSWKGLFVWKILCQQISIIQDIRGINISP